MNYIIICIRIYFIGDDDAKRPSRMQQPLNSELILTKEQLYDMFQQILGVKKFEHQILFNALMVRVCPKDYPNGVSNHSIVPYTAAKEYNRTSAFNMRTILYCLALDRPRYYK